MSVPVVEIENLVKRYQELVALDHFNLTIEEGEIFGLLGPNGSGKTTTINCILALLAFDKGTVRVFGREMRPDSYDLKRQIGVVMQNVAVFQELTVYENIDYFCGLYVRDKALRRQYVEEAIDFVGLNDFRKFYPKKLSGGLLRRLNIACGIAHKPKLIILDEPTAVLTPQEIDELMKIMKNLAKEGKSILFITHKLNEIMEVADRCTILRKGKYIGTVNISETSKEELSRMMVGRNVSFSVNKKPSKPGDTVLKVEHMTVPSKVHGNNAVKDVSFNVRKGEIVCIAGIDGNGQSEFVQGLTGLEKVSGGKILFNGQDITKASIRDRSKMGMSHIPEDRHKHGLVLDYSIEQNMVLQRYWQPEFESFGFIKSKAVREYAERIWEVHA
mgnify:CR=1 FL=1